MRRMEEGGDMIQHFNLEQLISPLGNVFVPQKSNSSKLIFSLFLTFSPSQAHKGTV